MALLALEHDMPRPRVADSSDRYRRMAERYAERRKASPDAKHCLVAIMAAADVLGLTLDELKRGRTRDAAMNRYVAVAFARIVKSGSMRAIGRVVGRNHYVVVTAEREFGEEIAAALGVEHESCK